MGAVLRLGRMMQAEEGDHDRPNVLDGLAQAANSSPRGGARGKRTRANLW
jgi:hypothetical protein